MKVKNTVKLVCIRADSVIRLASILSELPGNHTPLVKTAEKLNEIFKIFIKKLEEAGAESVEHILVELNKEGTSEGLAYEKHCKHLMLNLKDDNGEINTSHTAVQTEMKKQKSLTDSKDFSTTELLNLMIEWERVIQTAVRTEKDQAEQATNQPKLVSSVFM